MAGQRFTRSRRRRAVGGVCGGLGQHFGIDPVVFRVPMVVLSVFSGLGLIFYGLAWLLVPAEDAKENGLRELMSGRVEGGHLCAVLVALVGCGYHLAEPSGRNTVFALTTAVLVTGAAHWSRHRGTAAEAPAESAAAHAVTETPPEAQAPPVPSTPTWWRAPLTKSRADRTAAAPGVPDVAGVPEPSADAEDPGAGEAPEAAVPGRKARRRLGVPVFLLAVVAAALGAAVNWEVRPLGVALAIGCGCALAVFGLGLAVTAFYGRLGAGTLVAVVVTAVLLSGFALLPRSIGTEWTHTVWIPATTSQTQQVYRMNAGTGELDLSGLRLRPDETVTTAVESHAGKLTVVVPGDARVELNARARLGAVRAPLSTEQGGRVVFADSGGYGESMARTLEPYGDHEPRGTVRLRLQVGVGEVEVVRGLPAGEATGGGPRGSWRPAD